MSGDIFGDSENDDFELTPGGDEAAPNPRTTRPQQNNGAPQQRSVPPSLPKARVMPNAHRGSLPSANRGNAPIPSTRPTTNQAAPRQNTPVAPVMPSKGLPSSPTNRSSRLPDKPQQRTTGGLPSRTPEVPSHTLPRETLPQAVVESIEPVMPSFNLPLDEVEDVVLPDDFTMPQSSNSHNQNYREKIEQQEAPRQQTQAPQQALEQGRLYPAPERMDSDYSPQAELSNHRDYVHAPISNQSWDTSGRDIAPSNSRLDFLQQADDQNRQRAAEEENFYRDEEPEAKKGRKEKSNGKGKKTAKEVRRETKKDKPPKVFGGNRKVVLFARIGVVLVALFIISIGIKSLVAPPYIPTAANVVSVVKKDFGITKFPITEGNSFATAFTKDYLTLAPDTSKDRKDILKAYTSDDLASTFDQNNRDAVQSVIAGPTITATKSVDDSNAIYTISAKVNSGQWLYLDIPVYYDASVNAFSISGTPAFIAPPTVAVLPAVAPTLVSDTTLATTITPDMTNFFTQWASSSKDKLEVYLYKDATVKTRAGLQNTVKFVSLDDLLVEKKEEGDPTENVRKASATVTWASPQDPKLLYVQTYNLTLIQDKERKSFFYVADIIGGVSNSALDKDIDPEDKPVVAKE